MSNSFRFPVKTEKEIQEERLYPEGEFAAQVVNAEFKPTKSGDPMISLQLKFVDNDGRERIMFCGILLNDNWAWLHRHFWESAGCVEKYEQGELFSSEYMAKKVIIKIKNIIDKNTGSLRSNVVDFLSEKSPLTTSVDIKTPIENESFPDDTVPF